jgi:hypothetical protein
LIKRRRRATKQGGEGLPGAQVRSRTPDKRTQYQLPLPKHSSNKVNKPREQVVVSVLIIYNRNRRGGVEGVLSV